jgi:hypothetical protein
MWRCRGSPGILENKVRLEDCEDDCRLTSHRICTIRRGMIPGYLHIASVSWGIGVT